MADPIKISDEAMAAGVDALDETGVLDGTGLIEAVVRLVAEAVAPLIAAEVLRETAEALHEQATIVRERDGQGDAMLAAGIQIAAHRVRWGRSLTEDAP